MALTFGQLLGQIRPGGMASFYSQSGGDGSTSGDTQNGGGGGGSTDTGTFTIGVPNPLFTSTGSGGDPTTGGGGTYQTGFPVNTGGTTTTPPTTTQTGLLPNPFSGLLSSIGCSVADALLRIAFFVLGFIAIIGAIYLYKGSNPVLKLPANLTRTVIKHGKTAIEAGAEL